MLKVDCGNYSMTYDSPQSIGEVTCNMDSRGHVAPSTIHSCNHVPLVV